MWEEIKDAKWQIWGRSRKNETSPHLLHECLMQGSRSLADMAELGCMSPACFRDGVPTVDVTRIVAADHGVLAVKCDCVAVTWLHCDNSRCLEGALGDLLREPLLFEPLELVAQVSNIPDALKVSLGQSRWDGSHTTRTSVSAGCLLGAHTVHALTLSSFLLFPFVPLFSPS